MSSRGWLIWFERGICQFLYHSKSIDAGYLESIRSSIEEKSLRYLEMYTKSFDLIEQIAGSSLEQAATRAFSELGKAAGGLLAKTPIGKNAELDKKLIRASERLGAKAEIGAESKDQEHARSQNNRRQAFQWQYKDD